MEPALDDATFEVIRNQPRDITDTVVIKTFARTKLIPRKFQVQFALGVDAGRDVLCVAGTGSGKSLAFALIHFFRDNIQTWIVSPLNVIEHQMAADYCNYGLRAVAVNASTLTPELIKDIASDKYDIVISSPEAYRDSNKLRKVILSPDLAHKRHVTIVDEAHCITTWGSTGFRKDFERIGDMRIKMPNQDAPMCAATATLSEKIKDGVVQSLHMKPDRLDINLGCWRPSLRFGIRVMNGGMNSYSQVCEHFDTSIALEDTSQAMIFVEAAKITHFIARELRQHYKLSGDDASDLICAYHANMDEPTKQRIVRRFKAGKVIILITTEALTMGADFPFVLRIFNFTHPLILEIWLQRAGRGARQAGLVCICIILVTKYAVQTATALCKSAGIEVDPAILSIKAEPEDLDLAEAPSADSPVENTHKSKISKSPRSMSLEMAEYIVAGVAGRCLTEVIDKYFDNPAHTSCYDIGGCEGCIRRRQREEPDTHLGQRQGNRQLIESEDSALDDRLHKKSSSRPLVRSVAERKRFATGLETWRLGKLKAIRAEGEYDYSLDEIMTNKELDHIAKARGLSTISDFTRLGITWPGSDDLRTELLGVLGDLQHEEDEQAAKEKENRQISQANCRQNNPIRPIKLEESIEATGYSQSTAPVPTRLIPTSTHPKPTAQPPAFITATTSSTPQRPMLFVQPIARTPDQTVAYLRLLPRLLSGARHLIIKTLFQQFHIIYLVI
ncbi:DEAD/DEAH box helicase [Ceratobasidium sp. AG-Ba]|nr:DEAD/DEAH box helicase [Ceratobasidium sp. AG-Ba]